MLNAVLKFLNSKWFILILMVVMGLALPTTWHNFKVVLDRGQLAAFWWVAAVFICNALAVLMAFWKFMGTITKKEEVPQSQAQW
jgi:Zn-dependent protease with chaperone function